jgi:hypothetical protein
MGLDTIQPSHVDLNRAFQLPRYPIQPTYQTSGLVNFMITELSDAVKNLQCQSNQRKIIAESAPETIRGF